MSGAGGFAKHSISAWGRERGYQVYTPPDAPRPLPSILFLHGMGESGSDNEVQTQVGLGKALRERPDSWPFLVVFPQKLDPGILWPEYAWLINEILKDVEKRYEIDKQRIYLTGLSQGGNGTLELAKRLFWRFAAIAPICGWTSPLHASSELGDMPLWAFHGAKDPVVPASASQAVVDAMNQRKGEARITIYPEADHNSWDPAYAEASLPKWFLGHRTP